MCIGGQLYASAPKDMQKTMNVVAPGLGLAAKLENKLYAKTMPDSVKMYVDKLMPGNTRSGILESGDKTAKETLYNKDSESIEAANKLSEGERRLKVQRAFAEKYNNQVRLLS